MDRPPTPPGEPLALRRVAIDTYRENVAYLHRDCAVYRAEGFQALAKVEVYANGNRILAVLNVVDDDCIVTKTELGLSEQAYAQLNLPEGTPVRVDHAEPPRSMDAVRRKMLGERLTAEDMHAIAFEIADHRYSKMEMAAFLVSSAQAGLDRDEVLHLTRAMVDSGDRLDWQEPLVADKHCIGGISGNRTSMLIVHIVAAHGMLMPKTSRRVSWAPPSSLKSSRPGPPTSSSTSRWGRPRRCGRCARRCNCASYSNMSAIGWVCTSRSSSPTDASRSAAASGRCWRRATSCRYWRIIRRRRPISDKRRCASPAAYWSSLPTCGAARSSRSRATSSTRAGRSQILTPSSMRRDVANTRPRSAPSPTK